MAFRLNVPRPPKPQRSGGGRGRSSSWGPIDMSAMQLVEQGDRTVGGQSVQAYRQRDIQIEEENRSTNEVYRRWQESRTPERPRGNLGLAEWSQLQYQMARSGMIRQPGIRTIAEEAAEDRSIAMMSWWDKTKTAFADLASAPVYGGLNVSNMFWRSARTLFGDHDDTNPGFVNDMIRDTEMSEEEKYSAYVRRSPFLLTVAQSLESATSSALPMLAAEVIPVFGAGLLAGRAVHGAGAATRLVRGAGAAIGERTGISGAARWLGSEVTRYNRLGAGFQALKNESALFAQVDREFTAASNMVRAARESSLLHSAAAQAVGPFSIFGLSAYDQAMQATGPNGANWRDMDARRAHATMIAMSEGGSEWLSDVAMAGLGSRMFSFADDALKANVTNFSREMLKRGSLEIGKMYAAEVGTEMGNAATQAWLNRTAHLSDQDPWEAAKEVVPVAFGTTTIMGLPLAALGIHGARSAVRELQRANADTSVGARNRRLAAAAAVADRINRERPGAGSVWMESQMTRVLAGEEVDTTTPIGDILMSHTNTRSVDEAINSGSRMNTPEMRRVVNQVGGIIFNADIEGLRAKRLRGEEMTEEETGILDNMASLEFIVPSLVKTEEQFSKIKIEEISADVLARRARAILQQEAPTPESIKIVDGNPTANNSLHALAKKITLDLGIANDEMYRVVASKMKALLADNQTLATGDLKANTDVERMVKDALKDYKLPMFANAGVDKVNAVDSYNATIQRVIDSVPAAKDGKRQSLFERIMDAYNRIPKKMRLADGTTEIHNAVNRVRDKLVNDGIMSKDATAANNEAIAWSIFHSKKQLGAATFAHETAARHYALGRPTPVEYANGTDIRNVPSIRTLASVPEQIVAFFKGNIKPDKAVRVRLNGREFVVALEGDTVIGIFSNKDGQFAPMRVAPSDILRLEADLEHSMRRDIRISADYNTMNMRAAETIYEPHNPHLIEKRRKLLSETKQGKQEEDESSEYESGSLFHNAQFGARILIGKKVYDKVVSIIKDGALTGEVGVFKMSLADIINKMSDLASQYGAPDSAFFYSNGKNRDVINQAIESVAGNFSRDYAGVMNDIAKRIEKLSDEDRAFLLSISKSKDRATELLYGVAQFIFKKQSYELSSMAERMLKKQDVENIGKPIEKKKKVEEQEPLTEEEKEQKEKEKKAKAEKAENKEESKGVLSDAYLNRSVYDMLTDEYGHSHEEAMAIMERIANSELSVGGKVVSPQVYLQGQTARSVVKGSSPAALNRYDREEGIPIHEKTRLDELEYKSFDTLSTTGEMGTVPEMRAKALDMYRRIYERDIDAIIRDSGGKIKRSSRLERLNKPVSREQFLERIRKDAIAFRFTADVTDRLRDELRMLYSNDAKLAQDELAINILGRDIANLFARYEINEEVRNVIKFTAKQFFDGEFSTGEGRSSAYDMLTQLAFQKRALLDILKTNPKDQKKLKKQVLGIVKKMDSVSAELRKQGLGTVPGVEYTRTISQHSLMLDEASMELAIARQRAIENGSSTNYIDSIERRLDNAIKEHQTKQDGVLTAEAIERYKAITGYRKLVYHFSLNRATRNKRLSTLARRTRGGMNGYFGGNVLRVLRSMLDGSIEKSVPQDPKEREAFYRAQMEAMIQFANMHRLVHMTADVASSALMRSANVSESIDRLKELSAENSLVLWEGERQMLERVNEDLRSQLASIVEPIGEQANPENLRRAESLRNSIEMNERLLDEIRANMPQRSWFVENAEYDTRTDDSFDDEELDSDVTIATDIDTQSQPDRQLIDPDEAVSLGDSVRAIILNSELSDAFGEAIREELIEKGVDFDMLTEAERALELTKGLRAYKQVAEELHNSFAPGLSRSRLDSIISEMGRAMKEQKEGDTFFSGGANPTAAVEHGVDGSHVIYLIRPSNNRRELHSNTKDALHEFAHIWFQNLSPEQKRALERTYGADNGMWSREQVEKLVDDVVAFIYGTKELAAEHPNASAYLRLRALMRDGYEEAQGLYGDGSFNTFPEAKLRLLAAHFGHVITPRAMLDEHNNVIIPQGRTRYSYDAVLGKWFAQEFKLGNNRVEVTGAAMIARLNEEKEGIMRRRAYGLLAIEEDRALKGALVEYEIRNHNPEMRQRPTEIITKLFSLFGTPMQAQTKLGGDVVGYVNPVTGDMVGRSNNDIATATMLFAQKLAVERGLFGQQNATRDAIDTELIQAMKTLARSNEFVVTTNASGRMNAPERVNAFAKWMLYYTTNPEAGRRMAPQLVAYLNANLSEGDMAHIKAHSDLTINFLNTPAEEKARLNMYGLDDYLQETRQSLGDRLKEAIADEGGVKNYGKGLFGKAADFVSRQIFDLLQPVEAAFEKMLAARGLKMDDIAPEHNPIWGFRRLTNMADRLDVILNGHMRDLAGRLVSNKGALVRILDQLVPLYKQNPDELMAGVVDDFAIYLTSQAMIERMELLELNLREKLEAWKDIYQTRTNREAAIAERMAEFRIWLTDPMRVNTIRDVMGVAYTQKLLDYINTGKAEQAIKAIQHGLTMLRERIRGNYSGVNAGFGKTEKVYHDALKNLKTKYGDGGMERFSKAAEEYREVAKWSLKYQHDAGMITDEEYASSLINHNFYATLKRKFTTERQSKFDSRKFGTRIGNLHITLYEAKGSRETIFNPIIGLFDSIETAIMESDRNASLNNLRNAMTGNRAIYGDKVVDLSSVGYVIRKTYERVGDQDQVVYRLPSGEVVQEQELSSGTFGGQGVVRVMVNGHPEYMVFSDPLVWDVLSSNTGTILNMNDGWIRTARTVKKMMQDVITITPAFAMRNLVRDTWTRLNLSNNIAYGNMFEAMLDLKRPMTEEEVEAFYFAGGGYGYYFGDTENTWAEHVAMTARKLASDENNVVLVNTSPLAKQDSFMFFGREFRGKGARQIATYKRFLAMSEMKNRMAEFRTAKRNALKMGMDEYNAELYAANAAREMLDFTRTGKLVQALDVFFPFLNPRVQGLRYMIDNIRTNPVGFVSKFSIFSIIPMLITRAIVKASDDEEEYLELPAWRRDMYYNIKIGSKWITIPKPFDIAMLTSTAEFALDNALGNKYAADRLGGKGGLVYRWVNALAPINYEGSIIQPMLDIYANRDAFTGHPIVSPFEEYKALGLRKGTARASFIGKAISNFVSLTPFENLNEVDPRYVDHVIKKSFGTIGNFVVEAGKNDPEIANSMMRMTLGVMASQPASDAVSVNRLLEKARQYGMTNRRDLLTFDADLRRSYELRGTPQYDEYARQLRERARRLLPTFDITVEERRRQIGMVSEEDARGAAEEAVAEALEQRRD